MAESLICGCNPSEAVCCDRALNLMTEIRDAMTGKGTPFGFMRLNDAKENLANHYREAEEAEACSL